MPMSESLDDAPGAPPLMPTYTNEKEIAALKGEMKELAQKKG